MGYDDNAFCTMVKTLLGNAMARVNGNGKLNNSFRLTQSMEKGCFLASIL